MQLLCLVSMVRVVPFPRGKAQQICASGHALRVFQAGPALVFARFDGWTYTFKSAPLLTYLVLEGANQPERLSTQGVIERSFSVPVTDKLPNRVTRGNIWNVIQNKPQ